jgi:hypothetical protein
MLHTGLRIWGFESLKPSLRVVSTSSRVCDGTTIAQLACPTAAAGAATSSPATCNPNSCAASGKRAGGRHARQRRSSRQAARWQRRTPRPPAASSRLSRLSSRNLPRLLAIGYHQFRVQVNCAAWAVCHLRLTAASGTSWRAPSRLSSSGSVFQDSTRPTRSRRQPAAH